ncbi:winged helix family transcriptional regulator, partial [Streptomyces sp. SID7803]|nr:winged helix family transcriptional regulator [Streptomyces sp. SID7803]
MPNTRTISAAAATSSVPPHSPSRHRLRAVAPDEVVQQADVSAL